MIHRTTIIIPILEGEGGRARRAVEWYARHRCRLAIADGGFEPQISATHQDHSLVRRPGATWNELATEAIGCVTTPYALIADPDVLVHGDVLEPAASWLDAHPDFVGAQGRSSVALKIDGNFSFEPLDVIGMRQRVVSDDAGMRLTQVFDPYLDTSRALLRIETLRDTFWTIVRQEAIQQRRLAELLLACVAATDGKMRLLPGRWSVVEMRPSRDAARGLPDLLQDATADAEIDAFLAGAVSHFMRATGAGEATAKLHVRTALDVYLNRHLPREWRWETMTSEQRGNEAARVLGPHTHEDLTSTGAFMDAHSEA